LISALDGGEWSASCPGCYTPRERACHYPLDRKLGGPQRKSGHGGEKKNSQSLPGLKCMNIQPIAHHYTNELLLSLIHHKAPYYLFIWFSGYNQNLGHYYLLYNKFSITLCHA